MQKRLCLMLVLLSTMVLAAWADGASSFGDEDTGIEGIGQLDNLQSDNWYDLSGRKLSNGKLSNCQMKKGIYIHNGKKVVNK